MNRLLFNSLLSNISKRSSGLLVSTNRSQLASTLNVLSFFNEAFLFTIISYPINSLRPSLIIFIAFFNFSEFRTNAILTSSFP